MLDLKSDLFYESIKKKLLPPPRPSGLCLKGTFDFETMHLQQRVYRYAHPQFKSLTNRMI